MEELSFQLDRKELETEIKEYVKDWKNEELFALFSECSTYLSAGKNRIRALEQQGALKRIVGFFNGKNRKLKIDILKKTNETCQILFEMIRILTQRITILDNRIDGLCVDQIKIHHEILMLQKAQKRYESKLEEQKTGLQIMNWFYECKRRYANLPVGKTILSVVSDIFDITKGNWEINTKALERCLFDDLQLPEMIEPKEFYDFIIEDPAELSLYMKNDCSFADTDHISDYGRVICGIHHFYHENPQLIRQANERKVSPAELCIQEFHENWSRDIPEKIHVLTLCESLLYDLEIASYLYDIDSDGLSLETEHLQEDGCESISAEPEKDKCLIVFFPEKLQLISKEGENVVPFSDSAKHNLLLPEQEKMLKSKMDELGESEGIVVVPSQYLLGSYDYFSGEYIEDKVKFISMADYYMYLWYIHFAGRADQKYVVVMEEYDKKIQAREYQVTESGYKVCAEANDINYLRNGKHLLMDLEEKNFIVSGRKEEISFMMISDHKGKEEKKLSKQDLHVIKIDGSWEGEWKKKGEFRSRMEELAARSVLYEFHNEHRRFLPH